MTEFIVSLIATLLAMGLFVVAMNVMYFFVYNAVRRYLREKTK
jgi:hypothetical protein